MAILISGQGIYYIDSVGILYGNYFVGVLELWKGFMTIFNFMGVGLRYTELE